jgi:hypothetical protein
MTARGLRSRPSTGLSRTVEARYRDDPEKARGVLESVRGFVALAEAKELETGRPCSVRVEF